MEVWYEWSTWELLNTGSGGGGGDGGSSSLSGGKRRSIQCAISVLELAQKHIPDSTLLAYAHAQIMEGHDVTKLNGSTIVPNGGGG